ncbi:MAG: serine/threonine-protein kinase [bacterium]|nr:serine/threonine-protein kinase [bacterium]
MSLADPSSSGSSGDARSSAIAVQFLQQFVADRDAGTPRTLAEYQAMFAAAPDVVAIEYEALTTGCDLPAANGSDGAATSPLSHPAQGERYRDRQTIGRGGMGTVFRVFDPGLEREVAMKRLGVADRIPDAQQLGRFLDEAKVTGQLQHPGIVSVFEIGLDGGRQPYFTMPLIEGRSLQEIIGQRHSNSEWTRVRLLGVLVRVCEAMAYAHERGVIHRDLKPANVMVGRFGETYVVDWGLARRRGQPDRRDIRISNAATDSALRTMAGDVIGTPAYMAPEQARGELDSIDERSDIYSLGAMLYHLLAGTPPYIEPGTDPKSRETLAHVLVEPPRPLRELAPDVPPELLAICERAMARGPDQRYAVMLEFAEDLRAFLENRVVTAYATGPFAELGKWIRRNRALACASLIALLALAFGFIWSEIQRQQAVTNEARASREATRANTNADIAAENLEIAFEAGRDLLSTIGMHEIENDAGSDPIRRKALERALAYYERLRDLRGDDPRVDGYVARAQFEVAEILTMLGRTAEATAAWEAAAAATAQVAEKHGLTPELELRRLGIGAESHVRTLQNGDVRGAIPGLEEAVEKIAALRASGYEPVELVRRQSGFHYNLALAMFAIRNKAGALKHSAKTLELAREVAIARPDNPSALAMLGTSLMLRGKLMWQTGELDEAEARYQEGLDVLENALLSHRGHRGIRTRLGELLNLFSILRNQQRDPAAATTLLDRAIAVYRALVNSHPGVRDYHGTFAGMLCNRGIYLTQEGDPDAALPLLQEALAQARAALEIDPKASDFRLYRRIIGKELSLVLCMLARHEEAAVTIREWLAEVPETDPTKIAEMFATCVGVASADEELPESRRTELARGYGDEAMAVLQRANAAGKLTREPLARKGFDPVRDRGDFQSLLADLEK